MPSDTLPPLIEAVPVDSFGGQPAQPAQKRRGRPPTLNPDGTRKNPARGSQRRPTGRKRGPSRPRASARSLVPEIAAFLTMGNMLLVMSPLGTRPIAAMTDPTVTPDRVGDELDDAEIAALAAAIDAQCRRSPRFRKIVEGMLTAGTGGQLVGVLGIIATRRAARHGLAPAGLDPMLGAMLAGDIAQTLAGFEATPEADTTPNDNGEVPPDREATEAA